MQRIWPDENPFQVRRHELLAALEEQLGRSPAASSSRRRSDTESLFRYQMHTLPSEIGDRIGTSTLFAAWNAIIYVNQIEDERLESVLRTAPYLPTIQDVLQKYNGLWFNDESFVVARRGR